MKVIYSLFVIFIISNTSIKAQNSLSSDFFDIKIIKIIKTSKKIYDNHGTNGYRTMSIWRPLPESGYYVFGDMIVRPQNPTGNKKPITIAVKPKREFEYLLKLPISYEFVWNNSGSGGSALVNLARLICPKGYVALGMVAYVNTKKPIDCSCIKETVTHNGQTFRLVSRANLASDKKDVMHPFYDNHGTNADKFGSFWKPHIKSKPSKGIVSIPPNTFFVNGKSLNKIPGDTPYALNFKFNTDLDEELPASDH